VRNINIGHGQINWNNLARIPEQRRNEFGRFELSIGDILISLDRPIISTGVKVARVYPEDIPCLLLQRVGRVFFKTSDILPDFFFAWLQSPCFIDAIDPGRSNGVPHISPKDIEEIPFTPPSMHEQQNIVSYLISLESKLDALRRHQAETAAELDAILPAVLERAFRGEL
jgi:type I restriction enzyme S subunit